MHPCHSCGRTLQSPRLYCNQCFSLNVYEHQAQHNYLDPRDHAEIAVLIQEVNDLGGKRDLHPALVKVIYGT
jgi:hypothetical protein